MTDRPRTVLSNTKGSCVLLPSGTARRGLGGGGGEGRGVPITSFPEEGVKVTNLTSTSYVLVRRRQILVEGSLPHRVSRIGSVGRVTEPPQDQSQRSHTLLRGPLCRGNRIEKRGRDTHYFPRLSPSIRSETGTSYPHELFLACVVVLPYFRSYETNSKTKNEK